jgi:hypothetical protein
MYRVLGYTPKFPLNPASTSLYEKQTSPHVLLYSLLLYRGSIFLIFLSAFKKFPYSTCFCLLVAYVNDSNSSNSTLRYVIQFILFITYKSRLPLLDEEVVPPTPPPMSRFYSDDTKLYLMLSLSVSSLLEGATPPPSSMSLKISLSSNYSPSSGGWWWAPPWGL